MSSDCIGRARYRRMVHNLDPAGQADSETSGRTPKSSDLSGRARALRDWGCAQSLGDCANVAL